MFSNLQMMDGYYGMSNPGMHPGYPYRIPAGFPMVPPGYTLVPTNSMAYQPGLGQPLMAEMAPYYVKDDGLVYPLSPRYARHMPIYQVVQSCFHSYFIHISRSYASIFLPPTAAPPKKISIYTSHNTLV